MANSAQPGERFGRLVVVSANGSERTCRCDCGAETVALCANLTSGNTQSCGCLRRELMQARPITHGATQGKQWTRAYNTWHAMIQRCTNPRRREYGRYGGRGITVCAEWRASFEAFLADMGEPPVGHSLERTDNDGNYSKGNCVWAPPKAQNRNRSSNRQLAFRGRTQPLAAWAEELGIPYFTIHARLRRGWSVERALSEAIHVMR